MPNSFSDSKARSNLRAWMEENGHSATSIAKALRYSYSIDRVLRGDRELSIGFKCRFFRAFGRDALAQIFGVNIPDGKEADFWYAKESSWYPAQYAAHQALAQARRKGILRPASDYKCVGCDNQAKEYHHPSYHPGDHLCVVPLCKICHGLIRYNPKSIPLGVVVTHVGAIRIAIATSKKELGTYANA